MSKSRRRFYQEEFKALGTMILLFGVFCVMAPFMIARQVFVAIKRGA